MVPTVAVHRMRITPLMILRVKMFIGYLPVFRDEVNCDPDRHRVYRDDD